MSSTSLTFRNAAALSPTLVIAPGALALDVLSGIHSGVRAPIEGSACTIGSSRDCDLVLADKDVAPAHMHLRFYGNLVAIDAVGGDVVIKGRPDLARGYGCRIKLPATLSIGEATLRIARNNAPRTARRWAAYAGGALALAAVPVIAIQTGILKLRPQPAMAHAQQPAEHAAAVAAIPTPVLSDGKIVTLLQERIEQANLGMLVVSVDGRRIEVSGKVPPGRMAEWQEIQRWFDRTHGGRYVLTSMVGAAAVANAPSFAFQAVWFGKNPYVIDARGERRYPGAALQDGWMLKAIEPGQIVVVRGAEEFKLTL